MIKGLKKKNVETGCSSAEEHHFVATMSACRAGCFVYQTNVTVLQINGNFGIKVLFFFLVVRRDPEEASP